MCRFCKYEIGIVLLPVLCYCICLALQSLLRYDQELITQKTVKMTTLKKILICQLSIGLQASLRRGNLIPLVDQVGDKESVYFLSSARSSNGINQQPRLKEALLLNSSNVFAPNWLPCWSQCLSLFPLHYNYQNNLQSIRPA